MELDCTYMSDTHAATPYLMACEEPKINLNPQYAKRLLCVIRWRRCQQDSDSVYRSAARTGCLPEILSHIGRTYYIIICSCLLSARGMDVRYGRTKLLLLKGLITKFANSLTDKQ